MKKFGKEGIPMVSMEEKTGKFAEDADVQIQKKFVHEPGYDNSVDQSGLVVKQSIQSQWIPQAYHTDRQSAPPFKA